MFRNILTISFTEAKSIVKRFSSISITIDESVVNRLNKSNEDLASIIRFGRKLKNFNADEFSSLYDSSLLPSKTESELRKIEAKIRLICAEYEYLCLLHSRVPTEISTESMEYMLSIDPARRQMFLMNKYFRELNRTKVKCKKKIKRIMKPSPLEDKRIGIFPDDSQKISYGLFKNSLFQRHQDNTRLKLQLAINSYLQNPTLAFDWRLPSQLLNPSQLNHKTLTKLAYKVFLICNRNLRLNNRNSFNMLHLNLKSRSEIFEILNTIFNKSFVDALFFEHCETFAGKLFHYSKFIYVDPFAQETLDSNEIEELDRSMIIINPFVELYGWKKTALNEMFNQKRLEFSNFVPIVFRRLPLHDQLKPEKHLVLSFFIDYLRDVYCNSMSWSESLTKNIPKKYYENQF